MGPVKQFVTFLAQVFVQLLSWRKYVGFACGLWLILSASGVAIGIDECRSRARISRHELGVHEPPLPNTRLIADSLRGPLTYLYCEDEKVVAVLLALLTLHHVSAAA